VEPLPSLNFEQSPHQLEAVYQHMLPQVRLRYLLADDPGAGKTIMAGLLMKELKMRGAIERVLVVPASRQPVSTSDGRLLVRYLDAQGQPGCRPLYAYELTGWLAERGQADPTALVVSDATWDDLDPLEFTRLRRMVEENPGDTALLRLSDREIAGALGLARPEGDRLRPTLAGSLLVGKESALKECVPAHEVAFQVLRGTDVVVNEFRRWPLLRVHEWLMQAIGVRNEEQETDGRWGAHRRAALRPGRGARGHQQRPHPPGLHPPGCRARTTAR